MFINSKNNWFLALFICLLFVPSLYAQGLEEDAIKIVNSLEQPINASIKEYKMGEAEPCTENNNTLQWQNISAYGYVTFKVDITKNYCVMISQGARRGFMQVILLFDYNEFCTVVVNGLAGSNSFNMTNACQKKVGKIKVENLLEQPINAAIKEYRPGASEPCAESNVTVKTQNIAGSGNTTFELLGIENKYCIVISQEGRRGFGVIEQGIEHTAPLSCTITVESHLENDRFNMTNLCQPTGAIQIENQLNKPINAAIKVDSPTGCSEKNKTIIERNISGYNNTKFALPPSSYCVLISQENNRSRLAKVNLDLYIPCQIGITGVTGDSIDLDVPLDCYRG